MRLLNTENLSIRECHDQDIPPYAILSHRWGDEEVTYQDIQSGRANSKKGYKKLKYCCLVAASRGLEYAWIDTCCIDKSSSAELEESINSMFRWYQCAEECYAYLADLCVTRLDNSHAQHEFSRSVWFTRGWTLQELIAPAKVWFFNKDWRPLGRKSDLAHVLSTITAIDPDILVGKISHLQCPVAQRMAWAAKRTTSRLEDTAYSLLGIFNVQMPLLYGEGAEAFQRLQKKIIKSSDDHSLFAWNNEAPAKSFLAPSPSCFASSDNIDRIFPTNDTSQGFTLVNARLSIQLQLIPWSMNTYLAPLRCGNVSSGASQSTRSSIRGYNRACIFLQQTDHDHQFIRVSVKGRDLVVLSGDTVADLRDQFESTDRQVLIHQLSPSSHIRPAAPSHYGFVFSFEHNSLFSTGLWPDRQDALCMNKWTARSPVFKIGTGKHHAAGMFRLSGISPGHYTYFGFDRDFGPLCLITSRSPHSRRFAALKSDFQTLGEADALQILDLKWLRAQVEEYTPSGHHIFAYKGTRRRQFTIKCKSLSFRLVCKWHYSNLTNSESWHVSFKHLQQGTDHYPSIPQLNFVPLPQIRIVNFDDGDADYHDIDTVIEEDRGVSYGFADRNKFAHGREGVPYPSPYAGLNGEFCRSETRLGRLAIDHERDDRKRRPRSR